MGSSVVRLAVARERRLLERLGELYELLDTAEDTAAAAAQAIDKTLSELDDARLEASTPLPVTVAAGGA